MQSSNFHQYLMAKLQIISPLRNGIVTVDTRIEVDGQADSSWMFEESLLDDDHCVAVAVSRPNYRYFSIEVFKLKMNKWGILVEQSKH